MRTDKKKREKKNEPWTENYPPLRDWLHKHESRCVDQFGVGPAGEPTCAFETWLVDGSLVCIMIRADQRGWDVFTSLPSVNIEATLKDADERIAIDKDNPDLEIPHVALVHEMTRASGTLTNALKTYEATGDHVHDKRAIKPGEPCGGGDCNVSRCRRALAVLAEAFQ